MITLADILNRNLPSDPPDLSPEYVARIARDQQKVLQECRAPEPVPAAPAEAAAKIAANPMRLYRVHREIFTCFMTKPNEIPEDAMIIDMADPDPNYKCNAFLRSR
jgi:hypothetical protein